MNNLKKQSRNQLQMICLDSLVEKSSMARVIDSFVDASDLKKLGFIHYSNNQGRPSYPTDVMVKLYLYGYMNGIRTTRKLEKACNVNLELKWLLCGLTPKYRTIGTFRIQNLEAFNNLFLRTIDIALKHKLIEGKTLAFDSFPIRASNSRKNNYNKKKLGFLSEHAQGQLDNYIDQLESNEEKDEENITKLNKKIKHYEDKLSEYQKIDKQLKDENITQISSTDPDARIMSKNDRTNIIGYRTQCGADAKHKIICSAEVSNRNDNQSTTSIALQAKENIDATKFDALYDKGYHSGPRMAELVDNKITPYISPPKNKNQDIYSHSDFKYNKRYDSYTCPAGQTLKTTGKWMKRGDKLLKNYQNNAACRNCPLREKCTTRKAGRLLARYEHYEYVESNRKRIAKKPNYYRLRSRTIEHIFGTIKRHWGLDHTVLRTKEKVRVEFDIAFTSYNLMRIFKVLDQKGLKFLIQSLSHYTRREIREIKMKAEFLFKTICIKLCENKILNSRGCCPV